jgi:hypothetical protein
MSLGFSNGGLETYGVFTATISAGSMAQAGLTSLAVYSALCRIAQLDCPGTADTNGLVRSAASRKSY